MWGRRGQIAGHRSQAHKQRGKQNSDAFLDWAHMWFGFFKPQYSCSVNRCFWRPPSSLLQVTCCSWEALRVNFLNSFPSFSGSSPGETMPCPNSACTRLDLVALSSVSMPSAPSCPTLTYAFLTMKAIFSKPQTRTCGAGYFFPICLGKVFSIWKLDHIQLYLAKCFY